MMAKSKAAQEIEEETEKELEELNKLQKAEENTEEQKEEMEDNMALFGKKKEEEPVIELEKEPEVDLMRMHSLHLDLSILGDGELEVQNAINETIQKLRGSGRHIDVEKNVMQMRDATQK